MKPKNAAKQRTTYFEVIPVATLARLPGVRIRKPDAKVASRKRKRSR